MQRRGFLALTAGLAVAARWPVAMGAVSGATGWTAAASLPLQTQELYPAVHNGRLIVAGGIAVKLGVPYFTSAVNAYDPVEDAWSSLPDLPEPLHHVALVSTGKELWAIGGFNGGYTHIWRMREPVYKLQDDEWQRQGDLPTPLAEGVTTFASGKIHIVSGQQPRGESNSAREDHREITAHWIWDGDGWRSLAPIPTARNSATGGWIDDQLIVTGGRTSAGNLAVTEVYDAKEDRWRSAAPMPLPQAGTASVVHDDSLVVFGGEIFIPEADVFSNVWRYRLATDTWEALADMITPRHGLGAGLINERAYVVGGATKPGGSGTSDLNEVFLL